MKFISRMTIVGFAACGIFASHAAAQSIPEPFASAPADSKLLVRVDFLTAEKSARFGPAIQARKASDPDFPASMLFDRSAARNDSVQFLAKNFPGDIKIAEIAIPDSGGQRGRNNAFGATIYGKIDANGLLQRCQAAGWVQESMPTGGMSMHDSQERTFLTMPNDFTILMAGDRTILQNLDSTVSGSAPAMSKSQTPLGTLARTAAGLPMFMGFGLSDADRTSIAKSLNGSQQPNPMMMMPGFAPLAQELPKLQTGGFVLAEDATGVAMRIQLTFADPASAANAATAANQLIPAAIQMMRGFIPPNSPQAAEATAQMDRYAQLKFAANAATISTSIPIPDDKVSELLTTPLRQRDGMGGGLPFMMPGMSGSAAPGGPGGAPRQRGPG